MTKAKGFPELLRRLRRRAKLTQAHVAEACGAAAQTVSAWENGRGRPSAEQCLALEGILGVDAVELMAAAGVSLKASFPMATQDPSGRLTFAFTRTGFAESVRLHRIMLRLSREDVARACGVNAEEVKAWETGTQRPTLGVTLKLWGALQIRTEDLNNFLVSWSERGAPAYDVGGVWQAPKQIDLMPAWTPPRKMPLFNIGGEFDLEWKGTDFPDVRRTVQLPAIDPKAFACILREAAVEPDYRGGDVLIFSPSATAHSGDFALIRLDDRAHFRRVYLEDDEQGEYAGIALSHDYKIIITFDRGDVLDWVKMVGLFRRC